MAVDSPSHLNRIRSLVGDISENDLLNVDCYLSTHLGLFIPSLGHCGYAIKPQHTHPSYSFILFPSKEQYFEDLPVEVLPGQYLVIAISPDIPHQEPLADNFKRYFALCIDRDFYENQYNSYTCTTPVAYNWLPFVVNTGVMASIKRFMSEYDNNYPARDENLDALALVLTHQLIRSQLNLYQADFKAVAALEIENAINFMQQHYGDQLNIARLAAMAGLSESHFHKVFRRETGHTPMEFLNEIRLNNAKKMLRSRQLTITEIALQCGYNSASHFSSSFSKKMGISPSKYMELYNSSLF